MKIVLFDMNEQITEAWAREFDTMLGDNVRVFHGKLEDVPAADCLVAAGNSFGIMDGGMDAAMALQFPDVVRNVQDAASTEFCGEIPVGQSVIVPTGDDTFRWMAYTPTMRFPRAIAPELVYDAFRAALLAVRKFNSEAMVEAINEAEDQGIDYDDMDVDLIESIACPGLGTNTGQVKPFTAAKMMRLAYESVIIKGAWSYKKWDDVEPWLKKLYAR